MSDQLIALFLFISSVAMVIGLRKTENRLLGMILLFMAALKFFEVGIHFEGLMQGSMLSILRVLTGVAWLVAGRLGLQKKHAT